MAYRECKRLCVCEGVIHLGQQPVLLVGTGCCFVGDSIPMHYFHIAVDLLILQKNSERDISREFRREDKIYQDKVVDQGVVPEQPG